MNNPRGKSKTKVIREVIEREEEDDSSGDEQTLAASLVRPKARRKGGIDGTKTVEEWVFGTGVLLTSSTGEITAGQRQIGPANTKAKGKDYVFQPLAKSNVEDNEIFSGPFDAPPMNFRVLSPSPEAQIAEQPSCPASPPCPPPPALPFPPRPASSPNLHASNREKLQERIADVENQIAMLNLALQNQGLDTELSEESQLRFMSFLQKRVVDLEAKLENFNASAGFGSTKQCSNKTRATRGKSAPRVTRSPEAQRNCSGRERQPRSVPAGVDGVKDVMFGLLDLIEKRDAI